MKNSIKFALLTLVLALGASAAANALAGPPPPGGPPPPPGGPPPPPPFGNPPQAPEVDPSLAVAGISLLAGTLTVVRARSRK